MDKAPKNHIGMNAIDISKVRKERRRAMVRVEDEILSQLAKYRLTEKVTFEQIPEEEVVVSHVDIWEKCVPGRGNHKCKVLRLECTWHI